MLTVYTFKERQVIQSKIEVLQKENKSWADVVKPTRDELEQLSKYSNLPLQELQDALDKDSRPVVRDLEEYSLIVIKAPWRVGTSIHTTPISIFLSKKRNNVITIALEELPSLARIRTKLHRIDLSRESVGFFTYRLINEVFETYYSILDALEDRMELIERAVIKNPDKLSIESIFSVKKALIFFNKALIANREVITQIEKEYLSQIDKKNTKRFSILYADVTQLIDMVGTYKDIMTGTLDVYMSSVTNNVTQVMKTLTIISTFVLVPTLISSIYGMNFHTDNPLNMPELNWRYGYFFALALMVLSVLATYLYFRKRGWISKKVQ